MMYTIPLIVVPVALFGIVSYRLLKDGFEEQIQLEGIQLCQIAASRIEQRLDECYANMLVLQSEAEQEWNTMSTQEFAAAMKTNSSLTARLAQRFATRHSPVARIRVATADGRLLLVVRGLSSIFPDSSILGEPAFLTAVTIGFGSRSPQQLHVQDYSDRGTTSFVAPVFSRASEESLLGIILLDLDIGFAARIVEDMNALQPGAYFLFDAARNIIAAAGHNPVAADAIVRKASEMRAETGLMEHHGARSSAAGGMYISTRPVKEYIAYRQPVPEERWYIAAARSASPLQDAFDKTQVVFLLILGVAVATGVAGTVVVARRITRPIGSLTEAAQRFAEGHLASDIPVQSRDEIGELTTDLNIMADRLRKLMRDQQNNEALLAIGRLSASLVHDLRNPIEGLRLLSTELRKRVTASEPGYEVAETIHQSVERLSSLLSQSLDFSRLTHPVKAPVRVDEIVRDATSNIRSGGVMMNVQIEEHLPLITVDAAQVKRVLTNLLQNAVEACKSNPPGKGGRIDFQVERSTDAILFHVKDNGSGIPTAIIEKIYDPFFTTKTDGHGLGLSFARQILRNHGGDLQCRTQEGEGTAFTASLPLDDAHQKFPSSQSG